MKMRNQFLPKLKENIDMYRNFFFFLLVLTCGACSSCQSQKNTGMVDLNNYMYYLQLEQMKSLSVEEALKKPTKAKKVRLQQGDLNKDLSSLQNIEYIGLKNGVTHLPKSITTLKNLKVLDLSSNQFAYLPDDIGKLQNLVVLHITHTKIKNFPNSIGKLDKLKVLSLNTLNQLPKNLTKMKSLQRIYLNEPGKLDLKVFFKALAELPKLKRINAVDVRDFPNELIELKTLQEVFIPYSKHLHPNVFKQLAKQKNLRHLIINFANVDSLPESFIGLDKLEILDLRGHSFSDLSNPLRVISKFKNLRILHLAGGTFTKMPPEIGLLTNLEELYIWNKANNLKTYPKEVGNLKKLKKIVGTNSLTKEAKEQLKKWLPNTQFPQEYESYSYDY